MPTKNQIEQIKKIDNPLVRRKYTKLLQLPKNLQEAIFGVNTANTIEKIAKDNDLTSEQLWQFSYLVGMILLGELHIAEFIKGIQEKCKTSHEISRNLARQINKELFLSLKEDLKIVHKIPKWPREDEGKTPPPIAKPAPQQPTPPPTAKPVPPVARPVPPAIRPTPPVQNRIQQEESRTINLRK